MELTPDLQEDFDIVVRRNPGEAEFHVQKRLGHLRRGLEHSFERRRNDGRVIKTVGGPMPGGGYVMSFTDITSEARVRAELERTLDQLESRVAERTSELSEANRRLAESPYVAGDEYTIADIAIWPWYGGMAKGLLYDAGEFLQVHEYTHVVRWADEIAARPAVMRGRMVNRLVGPLETQLHERHDASDFDTRTQDKLQADT